MFAFVLMPFDKEFDSIYEDLIKPALESVGYDVRSADDLINQQNILKDIVCSVDQADLIVADLTALNANVLYELGIAHTLGKPTVMITQDINEVPFDLSPYRIIQYSPHYKDTRRLQENLTEVANKLKEGSLSFGNPAADFAPSIQQGRKAIQEDVKHHVKKVELGEILEVEEELGMWDFAVEVEQSLNEIGNSMKRMNKTTQTFGEKMGTHTLEINSIQRQSTPGITAHMHKKCNAVAFDVTQYAKEIEAELPGFHASWERLVQNYTGFFSTTKPKDDEEREALTKLKSIIEDFQETLSKTLASARTFRESIVQMKRLSQDLNRAVKHALKSQDGVIEELTIGESYLSRILNLINNSLGNP